MIEDGSPPNPVRPTRTCARSSKIRLRPTVTTEWGSHSSQMVLKGFDEPPEG
jgi:hypothetical protein